MILITLNEWVGPGKKLSREEKIATQCNEKQISIASRKTLREAVDMIIKYQNAYNYRYRLAVNFRLLQVNTIDELSDEQLDFLKVQLAESLTQKPEDF